MITIDCPFCDGNASTDESLTVVACDGCGVSVEAAAEGAIRLEVAA